MLRESRIARLPREVREQLNRRLDEQQESNGLLDWLNGLPEVQALVASEFGGRLLAPEDLCDWTENGYRDWVAHRRASEDAQWLASDVEHLQPAGAAPLTDLLARYLTAQYVVATKAAVRQAGGQPVDLQTLRTLSGNLAALRRGDQNAEWISIERARLELERRKCQEQIEEICLAWAKQPENQKKFTVPGLSQKEKDRRFREIFGLAPTPENIEESVPPDGREAIV